MEGLLPLVFKAIKKNRTRRQYECLSSGNALSYNISMAEIYTQSHNQTHQRVDHDHVHAEGIGHRRHKSIGDFGNGFFESPQRIRTGVAAGSSPPKQLVRFRSQRMFSCITGA